MSKISDSTLSPNNINQTREHYFWADILKIISAFSVVWIHTTANVYNDYQSKTWLTNLLVSAFTTFGVPCFYMISGALLLSGDVSVKTLMHKRIPRVFLPLIFWSFVYILVRKYVYGENISILICIIKSFFEPQYGHLWFMYPLIGLYFVTPIIAPMFTAKDNQRLIYYGLFLFIFIPAIFETILTTTGFWTDRPWFAFGFPELGLFMLGKFLFDNKNKVKENRRYLPLLIVVGYGLVVLSSFYLSLHFLSARKDFFNAQRIPVIIYSIAIFAFFVCGFTKVNMKLKHIFSELGKLSFGIYLLHPLVMVFVGNIQTSGPIDFTINSGSTSDMFFGAIFYFVITGVITFIFSRIPLIKKLI